MNAANSKVFSGEQLTRRAGAPALEYIVAGRKDLPLVVFVPGVGHLARIAYGVHEGARSEDFLAHWLTQAGYSFLGLSYPLETKAAIFEDHCPEFDTWTWGEQIAEAAAHHIERHGLPRRFVLLAWSMGGRSLYPAHVRSRELGLELQAVALAATPGLWGLIGGPQPLPMSPNGYLDIPQSLRTFWHAQIGEAIPAAEYHANYVGNGPVALAGRGEVFREGGFVMEPLAQAQQSGAFAVDEFPLVVAIANSDLIDARHALADAANWALLNANALVAWQRKRRLSPGSWSRLLELSGSLPARLALRVPGNHFCFVGASAARTTALEVVEALQRLAAVESALASIADDLPQSRAQP